MDIAAILTEIDQHIEVLQKARVLLTTTEVRKIGRPKGITIKRRRLSPEGRAAISAAMKARWASKRPAAKKKS